MQPAFHFPAALLSPSHQSPRCGQNGASPSGAPGVGGTRPGSGEGTGGRHPPQDTWLEVPERPGSPSTFPCLYSAQLPTKAAASFLLPLPSAFWAFTQKGAS